jgi:hypothetical protein
MLAKHPRRPNQTVFDERSLQNLRDVAGPHVQAFSYAVTEGLAQIRIPVLEFTLPGAEDVTHRIKITYDPGTLSLGYPLVDEGKGHLFPRECRGTRSNLRIFSVLTCYNRAWNGLRRRAHR